jgi:hypothetical protein
VRDLPIATLLDKSHNDVLCGHEGEFLCDATCDDHGIHDETFGNILQCRENDIGREEGLGQRYSAVSADILWLEGKN